MVVNEQKIFELFSQSAVQFTVPLFQRYYEWERPQWEKLWDDIEKVLQPNAQNHFFGAVVLQRIETDTSFSKFIIIDGQQRLTTISIFLCLLRNLALQRNLPELAKKINNRYLVNPDETGDTSIRLRLSSNGGDIQHYRQLVEDAGCEIAPEKHCLLHEAYRFFEKKLSELSAVNLEQIGDKLVCKFVVASIVLDPKDNPYRIFESLNARGKTLSSADLIRNFVFMRIQDTPALQEHIYHEYWLFMEQLLPDDRFAEFLRHFLITKEESFVRESDVYDHMCRCIEESGISVQDFLKMLKQLAEGYSKIICLNVELHDDIREQLSRLNRLNYTVAHPFLLQLYNHYESGGISRDDMVRSLSALESFLIRRMVCEIPTNRLNKIFPKLFSEILTCHAELPTCDFPHAVHKTLWQKELPNDAEFAAAFTTYKFYKPSGRNEICRFVLEELEKAVSGKELADTADPNISVEHVMPQTLSNTWESELGENWESVHSKHLHTIGNLTLTGYNAELSNSPYPEKQSYFRSSKIGLNQYFTDVADWSESAIMNRAVLLAKTAVKIWLYVGPAASNSPAR